MPLHLRRRRADGERAGDVGRAVEILCAGVDQIERARLEHPFAWRGRPVMHHCAVRPGRRDAVEADVLELARLAATFFELDGGGHLVDPPRIAGLVEPGEEACHGHAVAQVRGARALDLHRVLDRLGQDAGIRAGNELGALGLQQLGKTHRRGVGVEPHLRLRLAERSELLRQRRGLGDIDKVAQLAAHIVADLGAVDEQSGPTARQGRRHRRARRECV